MLVKSLAICYPVVYSILGLIAKKITRVLYNSHVVAKVFAKTKIFTLCKKFGFVKTKIFTPCKEFGFVKTKIFTQCKKFGYVYTNLSTFQRFLIKVYEIVAVSVSGIKEY